MSVQASLSLGAYDLKRHAVRSLAIAFVISLLFHIFLLGGKEVIDIVFGGSGDSGGENIIATGPVTLDDFEEELKEEEQAPIEDVIPPPPPMAAVEEVGTGSEGAMGKLVATEEVVDGPDIADMSEISFASVEGGGSGAAAAFDPSKIELPKEINVKKRANDGGGDENDMDKFEHYEQAPSYDPGQLRDLLEYPPSARENNIEGSVTISVRISQTGKPIKVVVRNSSNRMFEEYAKKAAMKLQYTPAIQNDHAVPAWVTFKIDFEFED